MPTATWSPRSTANGPRPRKLLGDKIKAKAQAKGVDIAATDVQQATRDSIHALMLIRAYRIRGHFHAKLDPLQIDAGKERGRARPEILRVHRSRPGPQDFPRHGARPRIRIDARDRRHPAPHLLRDDRHRVHAHLERRTEKLDSAAHRRQGQGNRLHQAKASARSSTSWSKPKASRNSSTSSSPAPSASASMAASR